ncbi:phosphotransferase [Rhizobiaceae bacterium n13]|uniref:Phosphotransferase n=1 Tax=Ferirhizobium litorale TaxID=2927786 RepID=A0AAE3QGG2_9HYPH|nr:phosphotransferase [Fererhizobium litorale]MDI7865076.1 phosphotransferase [Fererhizobium litorale]MDI7922911.1 phosphotransferase [Fererhizobium litorale]
MTSYAIDIGTLLSPQAEVLYAKWRYNVRKRIVRLNGDTYVLCRFRNGRVLDHFEKTLMRIADGGVAVQPVKARTRALGERLRFGHWIALGHVPGEPLIKRIPRPSIASLARNLGRLHSLQGPQIQSLFSRQRPELPHLTYLANNDHLSEENRDWIRAGFTRLLQTKSTSLTHGDLFGSNVIRAKDQSVTLIDYELLAYEYAGVELAACLLRNYCRIKDHQQVFLRAYLESCSPELRAAWEDHGRDFLFAGAARLALQRRQRARSIRIRDQFNQLQRWAWPFASREALRRQHENNVALIESRKASADYYDHIARSTADLCRKHADLDPLTLLQMIGESDAKPD